MNIKDRLKHVFKETFLDLFQDEAPSSDTIESAQVQARAGVEGATDALAEFTVVHVHLEEEYQQLVEQIETVSRQLEAALASNDDDLARRLIRRQQMLKESETPFRERVEASKLRKLELMERVEAMKAQVLQIERRKLELQLRDRAAEAIDQVGQIETTVGKARDAAVGSGAEEATLLKEAANQVAEEERNTLDSRLDSLLENDSVEQELARLKHLRNQQS